MTDFYTTTYFVIGWLVIAAFVVFVFGQARRDWRRSKLRTLTERWDADVFHGPVLREHQRNGTSPHIDIPPDNRRDLI